MWLIVYCLFPSYIYLLVRRKHAAVRIDRWFHKLNLGVGKFPGWHDVVLEPLTVKLLSGECHWSLQIKSQPMHRKWLGTVRKQATVWVNVGLWCRHMTSLDQTSWIRSRHMKSACSFLHLLQRRIFDTHVINAQHLHKFSNKIVAHATSLYNTKHFLNGVCENRNYNYQFQ